jgi:hypothetical protein
MTQSMAMREEACPGGQSGARRRRPERGRGWLEKDVQ